MKLVKFNNGNYGIRRLTLFGYKFKDLKGIYWWDIKSQFFPNCKGTEKDVKELFDMITDYGKNV